MAAISPDDVWVVGVYVNQADNRFENLAMHWDGTNWVITPTPNFSSSGQDQLEKVAAVGPNDVWVIGGGGSFSYSLHWTGGGWGLVPTAPVGYQDWLVDLSVVSANDIWAVGSADEGGVDQIHTLVEHWDGQSWTRVPSPSIPNPGGASTYPSVLNSVKAVSANDVWAVGQYRVGPDYHTLVEHWDGASWKVVPSPDGTTGTGRLFDITAASANDLWAVGYQDAPSLDVDGKPFAIHWDGNAWSVVAVPQPSTYGVSPLHAVTAVAANDVWAVGYWENAAQGLSTFIVHWDGSQWSQVFSPDVPGSGTGWDVLDDVAATSNSDVWTAGKGQATFGGDVTTLVERYTNPCAGGGAISFLTVSPSLVMGGSTSSGTVTLNAPAPPGGAFVTLGSSDTSIATTPDGISVPAGATSASFDINTKAVAARGAVTVTASWNGSTQRATVSVMEASLTSLTLSPTSVAAGATSLATVKLDGPAPAGGALVTLYNDNTAAAGVPPSVTVPAGATGAAFNVTTKPVAATTAANIGASYGGVTKSAALTINPSASNVALSSLTLSPTSVNGSASAQGAVILSGPAPAGGSVVALASSNTSVATVPSSVTVPAGATGANFAVTTKAVASTTSVTISASYGGSTRTAALNVSPAAATTDKVSGQRAEYVLSDKRLRVEATSTSSTATLKVYVSATGALIGTLTNNGGGKYSAQFNWPSNPQNITIKSSAGGSASMAVMLK